MQKKKQEQFKKNINYVLKDFQRNRQWADIGNWLFRLQQLLKNVKFNKLPEKLVVGKRLAQCLNPTLPPGVHGTALRIYDHIYSNCQDKIQLYPILSMGLFAFFEYSTLQLKFEVLKIIQKFYISTIEILPMLIALTNSLLTGLNQNHQDLARRIYLIFDKIEKIAGKKWIDGAVWVNILKSAKVRIAGFKYLMKVFKQRDKEKSKQKDKDVLIINPNIIQRELEGDIESVRTKMRQRIQDFKLIDDYSTRFPNTSCLVINALVTCLTQGQLLVQRSALELMISYLGLNEEFLVMQDRQILIQSCLHLLLKKQFALTRRIYTYLFGQPDTEGEYLIDESHNRTIKILQNSFFRVLNEEFQPNKQCPLLILEILFKEHPTLIKKMLPNISYNLLTYIYKNNNKQSAKLEKATIHFFNSIKEHLTLFLDSIVKKLAGADDQLAVLIIKLLDFYFFTLVNMKPDYCSEQVVKDVIKIILKSIKDLNTDIEEYNYVNISLIFCIKLISEQSKSFKIQIDIECIQIIEELIIRNPSEDIYANLLNLHPAPKHDFLIPHINEGALALISLKLLINSNFQIAPEHLDNTFFNLFRLLQCHLWEDEAIQLIKKFELKYNQTFKKDVQKCQISQWQIYWKRLNGQVKGAGVIRILKQLDDQNPLKRHTSQTWLKQSTQILSKILLPIYKILTNIQEKTQAKQNEISNNLNNKTQIKKQNTQQLATDEPKNEVKQQQYMEYLSMFKILKNIIINSDNNFIIYLFCQKDQFFNPLIHRIFFCIQSNLEKIKSQSIEFLQFLLVNIEDIQKFQFIQATLEKAINCLNFAIEANDYLSEIQLLTFLTTMTKDFVALVKWYPILSKYLQNQSFLLTILHGLITSKISYVKSQYIKFLTELGDVVKKILTKKSMSIQINLILERYFMILRETDVTKLEQIIQGKRIHQKSRKYSEYNQKSGRQIKNSFKNSTFKNSLKASLENEDKLYRENHIQNKYSDIIAIWNALKYYVDFSIINELQQFRVDSLLSLILNSFPFSYLNDMQYNPTKFQPITKQLYEQIKSVSGLRKQVLQIFDLIWKKYNKQILNLLIQKSDPRILIHSNIDPTFVMVSLLNSTNLKIILTYYKNLKLNLPKGYLYYHRDTLMQENKFLHFAYLYLSYANIQSIRNKAKFWQSSFLLIKYVNGCTTHTQSIIWLIEISSMLFQKFSYKDVGMELKDRNGIQEMIKSLIDHSAIIITKSIQFTQKMEIKTGLMGLFAKQQKDERQFDFVKIFPPTIFQLEITFNENKNNHDYYIQQQLFSRCFNQKQIYFRRTLAIVACKTLSQLGMNLIYSAFEGQSLKILNMIKQMMTVILPVCQNRSQQNQIYIQLISQVLHKVVSSTAKIQFLKNMKKPIFEIYMGNDFFRCAKKTLSYWKDIIDDATEIQDLFSDLLSRETLLSGLFTGKAQSTRLKIKSFQRICFLIYAGKVDKYQNKLKSLLESLNQVMKQGQNTHPSLLILILFCIRILIIRLSPQSLTKMFKTLWPSLLTLLLQIFEKRKISKNPNLILAALKTVQLINAMQIQEFSLHKWMFIFDYFGIHIEPLTIQQQQKLPPESFITPFVFEPLLMNVLPNNSFKCNFIPVLYEKEQLSTVYETTYRKMIIKEANVDSENELRNHAFLLIQYLINLNQKRVKPNKQLIQEIIETDFISLDEYIFDLK